MALLYGGAGRLTGKNGGFWPGQSVEAAGGPKIPMRYGRVDTTGPDECPPVRGSRL
jgi:hypothetical protein